MILIPQLSVLKNPHSPYLQMLIQEQITMKKNLQNTKYKVQMNINMYVEVKMIHYSNVKHTCNKMIRQSVHVQNADAKVSFKSLYLNEI